MEDPPITRRPPDPSSRPDPSPEETIALLREQLRRLRRRHVRLRRRLRLDPLTGLPHRAAADAWLARHGPPLTCLLIDLDGFKAVNRYFGHAAGDRALVEFARLLEASAPEGSLAARQGGDEFLLLVPVAEARGLAEDLRRRLIAGAGPDGLTASIGVASLRPGESAASLLARADAALSRAKRLGRDRVEIDEER